jgi:cysteine-rich repeat protein
VTPPDGGRFSASGFARGSRAHTGPRTGTKRVSARRLLCPPVPNRRPGLAFWRAVLPALALAVAAAAPRTALAVPPAFPGAVTATVASTDGDVPIPDNSSLVSILDVGALPGRVVDVDVAVVIEHTSPDQLDVYLVSPLGTTVTLTTDNGGGNDDVFAGTVFDDQASGTPSAPNVRNVTYMDTVPTGIIQPEEALAAFAGEPAPGPWALVIVDDSGGQSGTLVRWSLTVTTAVVATGLPTTFAGGGDDIPDNKPNDGLASSIHVSGVGHRLWDVDVTVSIEHPRADNLDLYLTSPSGRTIDLVTDVGGGRSDLYLGTTFDDQAGEPVSDADLPDDGTALTRVVPEGALGAFMGEDPNGTWTLTVADDQGGNTGRLDGWSLRIVTATVCGDGVLDAGEQCDDGNLTAGDGCDPNCTPTGCGNGVVSAGEDCDDGNTVDGDACPASCHTSEVDCGNCADDDANGLVDAADPACAATAFTLSKGVIRSTGRGTKARASLALRGKLDASGLSGPVNLLLADGSGSMLCVRLGALKGRGATRVASGKAAGGRISVRLSRKGRLAVSGHGLALQAPSGGDVAVGLGVGSSQFLAGGAFRRRGPRWVHP